jgi:DNA gyrase/topoisomerase IV subunit B
MKRKIYKYWKDWSCSRNPGMYVGGADIKLPSLILEVIDNSIDELI